MTLSPWCTTIIDGSKVNDLKLQSPVLLGGVNTNPPPTGGDEFGNFSGEYMSFGFPLIFALASRRPVFIQNVWLADAVFFVLLTSLYYLVVYQLQLSFLFL